MSKDFPVQNAGGLLIDSEGRMLLGLRAHDKPVAPDLWDIVGGRVEPGETPERALVREITEELGVVPICFRLLASVPEPASGPPEVLHHVFAITGWTGGQPYNACDEHSEVRWFTIEDVRNLTDKTPLDFEHLYARGRQTLDGRE